MTKGAIGPKTKPARSPSRRDGLLIGPCKSVEKSPERCRKIREDRRRRQGGDLILKLGF
ncbi:hypothetical protein HanRHA438_Chr04g0179891 [Helianthus annuus]|nr:hypothetical protein HanRHA438_Chr04g0179891 [Helianthus annuus]